LASTTKIQRPLSPHLQIYRWQYTMTLSILHRATGIALSVGLLLLIGWLAAVASGVDSYEQAKAVFAHPVTKLLLVAFSFSFFYHLANGVRHLVWDTVHGIERRSARASGWVAFLGAVAATVVFWVLVFIRFLGDA
jgi:succinate dehydrogenase / fumarate reductase cytochrome b subunit